MVSTIEHTYHDHCCKICTCYPGEFCPIKISHTNHHISTARKTSPTYFKGLHNLSHKIINREESFQSHLIKSVNNLRNGGVDAGCTWSRQQTVYTFGQAMDKCNLVKWASVYLVLDHCTKGFEVPSYHHRSVGTVEQAWQVYGGQELLCTWKMVHYHQQIHWWTELHGLGYDRWSSQPGSRHYAAQPHLDWTQCSDRICCIHQQKQ